MQKDSPLGIANTIANTEEAQSKNNSINLSIQQGKVLIHENK